MVAAQALARKNSRSMALIGNGAQSEFQALAFQTEASKKTTWSRCLLSMRPKGWSGRT